MPRFTHSKNNRILSRALVTNHLFICTVQWLSLWLDRVWIGAPIWPRANTSRWGEAMRIYIYIYETHTVRNVIKREVAAQGHWSFWLKILDDRLSKFMDIFVFKYVCDMWYATLSLLCCTCIYKYLCECKSKRWFAMRDWQKFFTLQTLHIALISLKCTIEASSVDNPLPLDIYIVSAIYYV